MTGIRLREVGPSTAVLVPLKLVQDLSKPFGTTISIEDNVGVIHMAPTD
jgi:hypothetical protein